MSNVTGPSDNPEGKEPYLSLVEGVAEDGIDVPLFSQDWGSPIELDAILASARATDSPRAIVQVVLDRVLPTELAENNDVQEFLHQKLASADQYYRNEIWPTYPQGAADIDKVIELYDVTEDYENCTLLHTLRSLGQEDARNAEKYKDAERIAQILIRDEITRVE